MIRRIIVHDEARFDVIDIAYYIAEDNLEAADRFAEAITAALEQLATLPGLGRVHDFNNPRLKGMRMWPVPGFPRHLIFYRASDEELRVIRVLHSARDVESLFSPQEESDDSPKSG